MRTKDAHIKDSFRELTKRALSEEDTDTFIDNLMEREALLEDLKKENLFFGIEEAKEDLLREAKIAERLEDERKRLIKDFEDLSRSKKAMKRYSPQFPLPSMPVFFDKKA